MFTVENDAVEMARISMEQAMAEMKAAKGADFKRAVARYMEASGAYRTMLRNRFSL